MQNSGRNVLLKKLKLPAALALQTLLEIPAHLPQAHLVQARLFQAHLIRVLVRLILVRLAQVLLIQVRLQNQPQHLSLHVTRENPRRRWRPALGFLIHAAIIQRLVRYSIQMTTRSYHRLRLAHLKSQKENRLGSKRQPSRRRKRVSRRQNLRRLYIRLYSSYSFSALSTLAFGFDANFQSRTLSRFLTHNLYYRSLVLTATFVSACCLPLTPVVK